MKLARFYNVSYFKYEQFFEQLKDEKLVLDKRRKILEAQDDISNTKTAYWVMVSLRSEGPNSRHSGDASSPVGQSQTTEIHSRQTLEKLSHIIQESKNDEPLISISHDDKTIKSVLFFISKLEMEQSNLFKLCSGLWNYSSLQKISSFFFYPFGLLTTL